jgi:hypothetical protein
VREELTAILQADLPDQHDAAKLHAVLYQRCYTHSILDDPGAPAPADGPDDLVARFEEANRGVSTWDEGWRIDQHVEEGCILARKGGAARAFQPGEYLMLTGIGCVAKAGAPIRVFLPAGSHDIQPGFWFAFGATITEFDPGPGGLRFYWNISAEGAPHLVESVTRWFNQFQIPFHLKCPDHVAGYSRRDSSILYVPRRYYPLTAMLIARVYDEVRSFLSPPAPLFTKPLADGLALAEDPGESFGMHRCRILAAAMAESSGQPVEERMLAVRRHFEQHRLQPDRPWLNPESTAEYPFPFPAE